MPAGLKDKADEARQEEMRQVLDSLKERCKRTVLRLIEKGEVKYEDTRKKFVYVDVTKGDYDDGKSDGEEWESDEEERKGEEIEEEEEK